MVSTTLQPTLPWMASHPEDRRFRLILLQVLGVCFAVGAIIPVIKVPLLEPEVAADLPPRMVRIIEDRRVPAAPRPTTEIAAKQPQPQASQPALKKRPAERQAAVQKSPDEKPQPAKAEAVVTPRQQAAQAGLLAMSEALSEFRNTVPTTVTADPGSPASTSREAKEREKASILTADVGQGSAGIVAGGVANQTVLGATGLPSKGVSGLQGEGAGNLASRVRAGSGGGGAEATTSGPVRSQEEIQEILDRNKSAMYAIYNRELRRDAKLQGKLVMNITIAPSGRVIRCSIVDSELGAPSLEEQLVRLIQGIDFGNKPGVPVVTTKVPIEFFPR